MSTAMAGAGTGRIGKAQRRRDRRALRSLGIAEAPRAAESIQSRIVRAQGVAASVAKDARNEHHRFNYASAEHVFAVAKDALQAAGLAVVLETSNVVATEAGTPDNWLATMYTRWMVVAVDGATLSLDAPPVPCVPGKGRPVDKAAVASFTTARSYFLQALLLLERVDKDTKEATEDHVAGDIAGNDDREFVPTEATKKPGRPRPANDPGIEVAELAEKHKVDRSAVATHLRDNFQGRKARELKPEELAEVKAWITAGPAAPTPTPKAATAEAIATVEAPLEALVDTVLDGWTPDAIAPATADALPVA